MLGCCTQRLSKHGFIKFLRCLVVCASAPQGNGITRAYSKTAVIGGPLAVEATEIDIKAAYETKNGAPTAAAPKVFMKYFLVNTKTGGKSGEMMAIARL